MNPDGDPGHVRLLMCTNAEYLQHAAVCLTSVLANNANLFFDIIVVGRQGEQLDEARLRLSLRGFPNHSLAFRQFTPPADRVFPLNPRAHYTLDIWTRIWVAEFFAEDVRRVLYLDSDIVVVGSLYALWHAELDGALLGAVDIPGSQRGVTNLGMQPEDGYFNSGVLLIDLEQWRRTNALETILDYVARNAERLRDPDQDALNACFTARRKRLPHKWNAIGPFFREPLALPLPRAEIEAVRREACVIHFNGHLKPWSYFADHPRRSEYHRYLEMTEWRGYVPPDRTLANRLRKAASSILPEGVKAFLKRHLRPALSSGPMRHG